jgi:uncharacterized membrane protein
MKARLLAITCLNFFSASFAFAPPQSTLRNLQTFHVPIHSTKPKAQPVTVPRNNNHLQLYSSSNRKKNTADTSVNTAPKCWNPTVRLVMGTLALAGLVETSFLTYSKYFPDGNSVLQEICGLNGDCSSVLNGPYSIIPGTSSVPLALLGVLAYGTVAVLALQPLVEQDYDNNNEDANRVLLAATSTGMGVFSACLMVLLFGVLHQNCGLCVTSAVCSILLAKLAWATSLVPKQHTQNAIQKSLGTSVTALVAAATIVLANTSPSDATSFAALQNGGASSVVVADNNKSAKQAQDEGLSPPLITTTSSAQALQLATKLQQLDTRLFGAYWCSHCYDQKQTLGEQAMSNIAYVECSKEGYQQQSKLCRDRNIPGYPTWEIAGKLYPGEQSLDELEEIVMAQFKEISAKQ